MIAVSVWEPVDPASLTVSELRQRAFVIDNSVPPEVQIPPGYYQCWLCRRVFPQTDPELAMIEYHLRFGDEADDPYVICDDCNLIVSREAGIDP